MTHNIQHIALALLMVVFVSVMMFLVLSNSLLLSLFMWEYLGLISYILVCYYDTCTSLRGALVTLFSSRFGDVGLFILLAYYILGGGSSIVVILCVGLIIFTKSACFPFISWLLEAMHAPTPVSSLVHSSTLVAAGAWFLSNYSGFLMLYSNLFVYFVVLVSVLTLLVSGICIMVCQDVKQIVALSTCNNISWVVLMIINGEVSVALVQLIVHGVSKCLLFTVIGDYILIELLMLWTDDSLFNWFIRYLHIWGVSVIFFLLYIHIARSLYYSSYSKLGVWNVGFFLYILLMVEAFLGYVLPWHQMSYWAATVLTSVILSIPLLGSTIYYYVIGGYSVGVTETLIRVFSVHVLLVIIVLFLKFIMFIT